MLTLPYGGVSTVPGNLLPSCTGHCCPRDNVAYDFTLHEAAPMEAEEEDDYSYYSPLKCVSLLFCWW